MDETKCMTNIGIMQGRLSVESGDKLQFFPQKWQDEFSLAKKIGFYSIEWLFDHQNYHINPIWSGKGRNEILKLIKKSGIKVSSICADYFMKSKLIGKQSFPSLSILQKLINSAKLTDNRQMVLPLLEKNAIKSDKEKDELISNLRDISQLLLNNNVKLALETELRAAELTSLLKKVGCRNIGVLYDIGNCTSYGFNCPKDLLTLADYIWEIHIKDRKIGSDKSVFLGKGDADFTGCFQVLKKIDFQGTIVLQAYRGNDYLNDAYVQLQFVRRLLQSV